MLDRPLLLNTCLLSLMVVSGSHEAIAEDQQTSHAGPACQVSPPFFGDEVWSKVGQRVCLKCHNSKGDAAESQFVLLETPVSGSSRDAALKSNATAFRKMAGTSPKDSRLLKKVLGGLEHGGGEVLKEDSTEYRILKQFVRRMHDPKLPDSVMTPVESKPFFDGLVMISPQRLLRRLTLSLAGRLPTQSEREAVSQEGLTAFDDILNAVMTEEAFYERLQEGFNDILLTRGYDGSGEGALSYEHFPNRLWYQKRDPGKLSYTHPKKRAYYELVKNYREAMRREPLELITHIVRENRPFTEIVTADYIMVSPYTSRGYGVFEEIKDRFNDPDDPFEFIPTRIKALKNRNGRDAQKSETGYFPHAGLLSSFQYLKRYPTTESNRNRLRVRMYFEHFLGTDIMSLAPRVNDAAAITSKYEVPTMEAADCVVCHKVIDPIAGLYQDYYALDGKGIYGPRKDGWYTDMFTPGTPDEELAAEEKWRSLQWLGEQTAKDPRFAVAMVQHVWYLMMGRKPLLPPEDIDDPLFNARRRAYRVQRNEIERVARLFVAANFNLKVVFQELARSHFYRVDGPATLVADPQRTAELDDVGVVRMLTPEQLERKIEAVFGKQWGRLIEPESKFKILYGGIDSKEVTERITSPSGAMGAIQRIMANDVACANVVTDFSRPPGERRLFPAIELTDVPRTDEATDDRIRKAIVHLHQHILGREDSVDHPEVERTFELFAGIVNDASQVEGMDKRGTYSCGRVDEKRVADPHYTLRAWRAVVTYMLRQQDFLYE